MPSLLNRYATPFITGLFLVSLVSGVALFFHLGAAWFHAMHEWLSLVLIVPFVLHLWKNWRPITCYLRRAPFWIAMAVSVAMAALFVIPVPGQSPGRGGPPQFAFSERMMQGQVAQIAEILQVPPEILIARLQAADPSARAEDTLAEIAARTDQPTTAVISLLVDSAD
ncbi:DUF4405 domain-containing protein [Rhodobacter sp. NTK016B]|uniref:DUF4405 domain-containing protein n=1 Tax=Rhodobacter sp. NTK016B TaxID=2759676 RepID=UPI001A8C410C|nr:DUF4405 domain-containing protein [Rhodobacter sp. NTK016B]MBN8293127.1 DUF4405 domain-containing protein [Rhodobacter sp. NTK016B]